MRLPWNRTTGTNAASHRGESEQERETAAFAGGRTDPEACPQPGEAGTGVRGLARVPHRRLSPCKPPAVRKQGTVGDYDDDDEKGNDLAKCNQRWSELPRGKLRHSLERHEVDLGTMGSSAVLGTGPADRKNGNAHGPSSPGRHGPCGRAAGGWRVRCGDEQRQGCGGNWGLQHTDIR